mgnify:CR=1 FL=1
MHRTPAGGATSPNLRGSTTAPSISGRQRACQAPNSVPGLRVCLWGALVHLHPAAATDTQGPCYRSQKRAEWLELHPLPVARDRAVGNRNMGATSSGLFAAAASCLDRALGLVYKAGLDCLKLGRCRPTCFCVEGKRPTCSRGGNRELPQKGILDVRHSGRSEGTGAHPEERRASYGRTEWRADPPRAHFRRPLLSHRLVGPKDAAATFLHHSCGRWSSDRSDIEHLR